MSNLRRLRNSLIVLTVLSWSAHSARAGLVADSGQVLLLSNAPNSVQHNDLASNSSVFLFAERQSITLPSGVTVDATQPGTVSSYGNRTPGVIAAGTKVDSYFLHSNGVGTTEANPAIFDGSITFNSKILGVIALDGSLDASDSILGSSGTSYGNGVSGRGMELNPLSDYFSLSSDDMTITFHFNTGGVMDELRLITASSVPEPASVVMMGLGGLTILGMRLFRRKRDAA